MTAPNELELLDTLTEAFTSVSIGQYGDPGGRYAWEVCALRNDTRPTTGLIYTDDRDGYVTVNGTDEAIRTLQVRHYGATRAEALASVVALAAGADALIAGEA